MRGPVATPIRARTLDGDDSFRDKTMPCARGGTVPHGTMYHTDQHRDDRPADTHRVEIRVRYAECDAMGHLHHARYWDYFEQVRTELLRRNGIRYRDLEAQGVFFVVYKAECKYLRPIRYDDVATVSTTVTRITRTRVDHAYEIHTGADQPDTRALACRAATTLACVGPDGRPITMPDALWASAAARR